MTPSWRSRPRNKSGPLWSSSCMQRWEIRFSCLKLLAKSGIAEASQRSGTTEESSLPHNRVSASSCKRGSPRSAAHLKISNAWRALSTTSEFVEAFEIARVCFGIQRFSLRSLAPGPATANPTAESKAPRLTPTALKSTTWVVASDPSVINDANAGNRELNCAFRISKSWFLHPAASMPNWNTTLLLKRLGLTSSQSPQNDAPGASVGGPTSPNPRFRDSKMACQPLSASSARFVEAGSPKSPHTIRSKVRVLVQKDKQSPFCTAFILCYHYHCHPIRSKHRCEVFWYAQVHSLAHNPTPA